MKLSAKRLHKKGSLELSVNAIVVLVMAIAVLGLGLAFIRGLIQKGQEKFDVIITGTELENPARADKPLVVDAELAVKRGSFGKMVGSVYNVDTAPINVSPVGYCPNGTVNNYSINITTGSMLPVPDGQAIGFRAGIAVDSTVPIGTYTCIMDLFKNWTDPSTGPQVTKLYSGQFFISVRQ
ncbi:MAG: hypothetical protein V1725_03990 [archaeon]